MSFFKDKQIIVTGANRGVGLALTQQLLSAGAHVYAGTRQPKATDPLHTLGQKYVGRLSIETLDVTHPGSVAAFTEKLGSQAIDVLINNAGVNLDHGRSIEDLPADVLAQTFDANTLGPFRMMQAVLPALHKSEHPIIANISSIMGSIAENQSSGSIAYRVSKTATNMLTRCLALEDEKVVALTLHPGWVKTRMGGDSAHIDVDTSARGLLEVIGRSTHKDSGKFFRYSGEEAPW